MKKIRNYEQSMPINQKSKKIIIRFMTSEVDLDESVIKNILDLIIAIFDC
jgi:hypothetical protein